MSRELHVHTHPPAAEHWRHIIEIAALSIAAIWGFYVFIYQEKIKPETSPPVLERSVAVDAKTLASGKEFVKVSVTLKNIGESTVDLDAIIVNMYGVRFANTSGRQATQPLGGIELINFGLKTSERKPLYSFYDTWKAVGSPKPTNVPILPGQSWTESFVVGVHPREYDFANLSLYYCFSHVTDRIWPGRKVYNRDGTASIDLPDDVARQGLFCTFQRAGLLYPL